MKNQITITWNPYANEETKITFSQSWEEMTNLEKADNLKDAIGELKQKYSDILAEGL